MFAARDGTLAAVQGTEEVVLWFERDLYDQLQLIQILDRLGARRASLIDLGEPRRNGGVDVLALYERRVAVAGAARQLGRDAWRAFTSPDPTDLERLLDAGTADLPFVEAALLRQLEEFPSTRDGLSRTERQLLGSVALGVSSESELFERTTAPDERPVSRRRPVPPVRRAPARRPRAAAHRAGRGLRADGGRPGGARGRGRPREAERARPLARGRPSPRRGSGVALGWVPRTAHASRRGVTALQSGRRRRASQCRGRTAEKWRRSSVITTSVSSRAARATTEASVLPSGKSAYCSTSSAMRGRSSGAGASTVERRESSQEVRRDAWAQPSLDEVDRLRRRERWNDELQVGPTKHGERGRMIGIGDVGGRVQRPRVNDRDHDRCRRPIPERGFPPCLELCSGTRCGPAPRMGACATLRQRGRDAPRGRGA